MANLKSLSVASLGAVFMALETTCAVQAQQIFYGNPQPVGDGFVRSYVTLDDVSGTPLDIGVDFSPEVLSSPDFVAELVLPPEASATAFKHLELTYDSRGLPGNPEVFNVPRYRVDFFLIDRQERDLICPNPDTTGPNTHMCWW